jgi:hypothetical protein
MSYNNDNFEKESGDKENVKDPQHLKKELEGKLEELQSAWSQTYQEMTVDLVYLGGGSGMWSDNMWSERKNRGRPSLCLPLTNPYVDRVSAPIRATPPSISVRTTDKDLEAVVSGILRGIERASNASECYATAIQNSAACGLGWLRIAIEQGEDGKVLRIKTVLEPTSIMIDPWSYEVDGSDAKYAVHHGSIEKDIAEDRFGKEVCSVANTNTKFVWNLPPNSLLDVTCYWLIDEGCKVIRYVGNTVVSEDIIPGLRKLPIFPVIGNRITTRSGRRYSGLVSRTKDLNTSVNIAISNVMEMVAAAPKSPWLVHEEAIEGHKDAWATANTEIHAYLPYKGSASDGSQIPMPMRLDNQPMTAALQGVADWMVSMFGKTTGISDAMLGGLESASESGKSLIARMKAAEASTALYVDHLTSSITAMAQCLIHMIPLVYDTERSVNIIDEYGRSNRVKVDLSTILTPEVVSMLDIEVESGPNMELQRMAAGESLQAMISAAGEKGIALLDIWAETQNLPNSDKLQERLKKIMPPEFMDQQEQQGEMDPQAKQALDSADQAIQEKDTTIQQLEGMLTQLQSQVNSQHELALVEKYKVDVNAEVTMRKTEMETEKAIQVELIKQGATNQRLTAQLSADQQTQVDEFVRKLLNTKVDRHHDMLDKQMAFEETAKVPQYLAQDIVKANANEFPNE